MTSRNPHKYIYCCCLLCCLLLWAACGSPDAGSAAPSSDAVFMANNFPLLNSALPDTAALRPPLTHYAQQLYDKKVHSQAAIIRLFEQRDTLMRQLHTQLLDSLSADYRQTYFTTQAQQLDTELAMLGMKAVYAERIYVGLAPLPMLQNALARYAQADAQQYAQLLNHTGVAEGGYYYPYTDLSDRLQITRIGEQLRQQYPNSPYSKRAQPYIDDAINSLTDLHSVVEFDTTATTIIGALHTEPYPMATDTMYHRLFVRQYPQSGYAKVVQRILNNMSTMQLNYYFLPRDVYLLVADWYPYTLADANTHFSPADTLLTCCPTATAQRNAYPQQGVDVPHVVVLHNGKQKICALVYRFYSSKELAEQNLAQAHATLHKDVWLVSAKCDIAHYLQNPKWTIIGIEQAC